MCTMLGAVAEGSAPPRAVSLYGDVRGGRHLPVGLFSDLLASHCKGKPVVRRGRKSSGLKAR